VQTTGQSTTMEVEARGCIDDGKKGAVRAASTAVKEEVRSGPWQ
jgi:hypothetical protein